ncbi:MAG: Aspartate carbamoyltransferase, partial [uncultured Solirubrobacteraceae bacterium]
EAPAVHRGPRALRHRAHPRPRPLLHRGLRARDQEGPRPARTAGDQPLLRGLDAHALVLRAGGQDAVGRGDQLRRLRVLGREGRVAQGHRPDPVGLPPGPHRRADAARRSRRAGGALEQRRRGQRGRRQARAPHPGAARRLHAPRAPRLARRLPHLGGRRRPALARGALEHPRLQPHGRPRHRLRPAHADPARHGGARLPRRAHPRPAQHGRRRLRAAHAARADERDLRPQPARVRRPLPDQRPAPRRAAGPDASRTGQPRSGAVGRGDRLPAGRDRPAGRRRRRRAHGGPLRAAGRARRRFSRPGRRRADAAAGM